MIIILLKIFSQTCIEKPVMFCCCIKCLPKNEVSKTQNEIASFKVFSKKGFKTILLYPFPTPYFLRSKPTLSPLLLPTDFTFLYPITH
ncbi:unnamed protein product [Meloidogyne enterolobii]|uniref:Uncharacterized protein n=1 Tax=Meloidogyne enterolobii TaxID=390850 RepID=A0ACB0XUM3_MELEN